jgi:hypothetical protein
MVRRGLCLVLAWSVAWSSLPVCVLQPASANGAEPDEAPPPAACCCCGSDQCACGCCDAAAPAPPAGKHAILGCGCTRKLLGVDFPLFFLPPQSSPHDEVLIESVCLEAQTLHVLAWAPDPPPPRLS